MPEEARSANLELVSQKRKSLQSEEPKPLATEVRHPVFLLF